MAHPPSPYRSSAARTSCYAFAVSFDVRKFNLINRSPSNRMRQPMKRSHLLCLIPVPLLAACSGPSGSSPETATAPSESAISAPSATNPSLSARTPKPVSFFVWPGADCSLHPTPSFAASDTLDVFADELGMVSFVAAQAIPGDAIESLSLDCHDVSGRTATYVLDLTSTKTFDAPAPIPPSQWPPGVRIASTDGSGAVH